ncbi:MAG: hypothetical protein OCD00_00775 [Colwellia sp.]
MDHQVKKEFGFLKQIKALYPDISCKDILRRALIWKVIIENFDHLLCNPKAENI